MKSIVAIALAVLGLAGCSSSPQRTTESDAHMSGVEGLDSRAVTNAAAKEVRAHDFVEITFDPGSADLSRKAKRSLRNVIAQAKASGKIDEILVMSWSDQELPSTELKRLPKRDRDLADKRNVAIRKYIGESTRSADVDTYNMASQPNALSRWFNTTDTRLKKSFMNAGLPTTADESQYPSKASHSVVLVKIE